MTPPETAAPPQRGRAAGAEPGRMPPWPEGDAATSSPPKGLPPLQVPVAGVALEERLRAGLEARRLERPRDGRLSVADAQRCARAMAFSAVELPPDLPLSQQALVTIQAGDWYRKEVQESLAEAFGARADVAVDWRPTVDLTGSCHAVYEAAGRTVAVTVEPQAGYGFDLVTGARWSAEGPGPRAAWLVEAGLCALAPQVNADDVHVVLVNKDQGTVAEWVVGVDDALVHLDNTTVRKLVETELWRMGGVLSRVAAGDVPRRVVPGHGLVASPPASGTSDKPWQCRYCAWQPTCARLASGVVPGGLSILKSKSEAAA